MKKFRDVYQLLSFFNSRNPARMKLLNILEADHIGGTGETFIVEIDNVELFEDSEAALWATICSVIYRALRGCTYHEAQVFTRTRLGPFGTHEEVETVAHELSISNRTAFRWISKARDEIERIGQQFDLIEI